MSKRLPIWFRITTEVAAFAWVAACASGVLAVSEPTMWLVFALTMVAAFNGEVRATLPGSLLKLATRAKPRQKKSSSE
jgi:hypothetical protein